MHEHLEDADIALGRPGTDLATLRRVPERARLEIDFVRDRLEGAIRPRNAPNRVQLECPQSVLQSSLDPRAVSSHRHFALEPLMADDDAITDKAVEARLGVALDALGDAPGATPLGDNALRGARQVLLAFKMALLSQEPVAEPRARSDRQSTASSEPPV